MWTRRAFAILLPASALPLRAQDDTTTLRVEVKSPAGKPVERASVIVTFKEGRSIKKLGKNPTRRWEVRTNQMGLAKFPPMPQGKILVQVIAKGYQTLGQDFEIAEPEKTIELKLNPPQAQYSAH